MKRILELKERTRWATEIFAQEGELATDFTFDQADFPGALGENETIIVSFRRGMPIKAMSNTFDAASYTGFSNVPA